VIMLLFDGDANDTSSLVFSVECYSVLLCSTCRSRIKISDCEVDFLDEGLSVQEKFWDEVFLQENGLGSCSTCPTIPIHPQSLLTAAVDHLMTSWSRCRLGLGCKLCQSFVSNKDNTPSGV
jgi:hypothetical protein